MKRILLGAASLAALIATPAAARDHSAYFGIEVGPMWATDSKVRVDGDDLFKVNHKLGVDGDLIAGYDFGIIRAELEASHKWAKHDNYHFIGDGTFDSHSGHSRAYSGMANVMADLGKNESFNFYIGGGVGIAWVRGKFNDGDDSLSISDSGLAWQGIAGIRAPVFRYFDIGLKYRYFNAGRIKDNIDGDSVSTRFRSHSVLASLIYNFAEAAPPPPPPLPPPPPPPPPPPATQTCPDGSVILATDACPVPPPPPPPPPPAPERGY
jgi:opacity protein-like surface antigen